MAKVTIQLVRITREYAEFEYEAASLGEIEQLARKDLDTDEITVHDELVDTIEYGDWKVLR